MSLTDQLAVPLLTKQAVSLIDRLTVPPSADKADCVNDRTADGASTVPLLTKQIVPLTDQLTVPLPTEHAEALTDRLTVPLRCLC